MPEDRIDPQDGVPGLQQIPGAQCRETEQDGGRCGPPAAPRHREHGGPRPGEEDDRDDERPDHHGATVSRVAAHIWPSPMIAGCLISPSTSPRTHCADGRRRGSRRLRSGRRPRCAGPRQDRAPRRPVADRAGSSGTRLAAQGRPRRCRAPRQRRPHRGPARLRRASRGAARRTRRGRTGRRAHRRHAAVDAPADRRPAPDHDPGRARRRHLRRDGLGTGRGARGRDRAVQLRRAELPAGPPGAQRAGHLPRRPRRVAAGAAHPHLARCRSARCWSASCRCTSCRSAGRSAPTNSTPPTPRCSIRSRAWRWTAA